MKEVNFAKLMLLLAEANALSETDEQKEAVDACMKEAMNQMQRVQENKKALYDLVGNF